MINKTNLDKLPPIFFPSEVDIDKELFHPITSSSKSLDCMVGYFSSGFLSELSNSISSYLRIETSKPMRFIVSPHLDKKDIIALKSAYRDKKDYFSILFPDYTLTNVEIRKHAVSALAFLIISKKIELRVALKREGMFHSKVWLFETDQGAIAVHGSANATAGGLVKNFEQLAIARSWMGKESEQVVNEFRQKFEEIWNGHSQDIEIIELNENTINTLAAVAKDYSSYKLKHKEDLPLDIFDIESPKYNKKLKIPPYLNYREGRYSHQGDAVDQWFGNNCKGIFSIATGGGKTYTSLICASLLQEQHEKLLVIIAVPTKALMNQWEGDVNEFGIQPINTNSYSRREIRNSIKTAIRNLRFNVTESEVLIVTHNALLSGSFAESEFDFSSVPTLLIVDEAHNIGSESSQKKFPSHFKNMLGLSATYERQYDAEGTEFLLKTFDKVVFEFGLDKAIGNCLVPYDYFAHFVPLTAEEEDNFLNLTYEIKKLAYAMHDKESAAKKKLEILLLARRRIIENAANKLRVFESCLPLDSKKIQKTLIFCTDKAPEQLEHINALLNELGVNFHQVTAEETSNNKLLKEIIEQFSKNQLQVLTSKRVLDEGFNVPQTETAYLLASNTVVRQWTQRLGRVLRISTETGKKYATLHDFIAMPVVGNDCDEDLKSLILSEYRRVEFFSKFSSNYSAKNGGFEATQKILEILGEL